MQRREFVGVLGAASVGATHIQLETTPANPWRRHFPALAQEVGGQPLAYLDSAATTLRPRQMIDAVSGYYARENANPGAALHTLARRSAAVLDEARQVVARFINAQDPLEIVFTRGTTDGLNLVATSWCGANLRAGDEILVGLAEHASNMLPWQMAAARAGARVRYFGVDDLGRPRLDELDAALSSRTKVVAFSHVSNVLGMINPAREMCARARAPGRIVVVDAAQSVPHLRVDVREMGCDVLAFSSHKLLGPMGVGVLYGRRELLDAMPPYQGGSNMAHDVGIDGMHLSEGALKFGAGTPNVSGPVGLAAALRLLDEIGASALREHEIELNRRMLAGVARLRGVRLLGSADAEARVSVFSFTVANRTPQQVMAAMDARGIAIRAGDLASLPLLQRFGCSAAARVSCYLYTDAAEIDRALDVLAQLG
jgi:cysteine desulfurase / selenocysteine lyase